MTRLSAATHCSTVAAFAILSSPLLAPASVAGPGGVQVRVAPTRIECLYSQPTYGDFWQADFDHGGMRSRGLAGGLLTGCDAVRGPWQVQLRWRARGGEALPLRGRLLTGFLAWRTSALECGIGRRARWWAPLPAAELLISAHGPPLDQVWLQINALRLPAGFGRLGAEAFLAYLDDGDRAMPYPLLWGMRAGWTPHRWLTIEAQRTIMLGGGGRTEKLTFGDLVDIFLGRRENLTEPPYPPGESDQRFAWQAILRLTDLVRPAGIRALEIVGTYAGEDALDGIAPRAPAKTLGVRLLPRSAVVLQFAFARNTDDRQHWYHHKIYRSGYTYHGYWLGHPMGGDARTWRAQILLAAPRETHWSLRIERERRGYFWHRRGTFPHEEGGFWRWELAVRAPVRGLSVEASLGGASAWGGDLRQSRLAEGVVQVALVFFRKGIPGLEEDWLGHP